jgi:hypothetical protein
MILQNDEKHQALDSITIERERWRGVDLNTRISYFRSIYIEHQDLVNAEKMIKCKALEIDNLHAEQDDDFVYKPTVTHGVGITVIGEPGAGKSTFAEQMIAQDPPIRTLMATYLPTIYMKVPNTPTEKSMSRALLEAMGHPDLKGTADDMSRRGIQLMRRCRVRRLIIDDFQDIPATRIKGVQRMGDWIRRIIDSTSCVVVAMGTPAALIVRDSNDQLQRRMQATVNLLPFIVTGSGKISERSSVQRWMHLLESIDAKLPLAESSCLSSPSMATRLMQGTNARFGHLSTVLKHGIRCAVETGSERIEVDHLQVAFKRAFGSAADNGNPFDPDYDGEPLTGAGQAFARVVAK